MSIFQTRRVALPREQWRRCDQCSGTGHVRLPPYGTAERCSSPLCDGGTIKYRAVRASAREHARAHAAATRGREE